MLAPLGVSTGDGRRFLASGVTNRQLPLPMKWQRADSEGHEDSVIVGSCTSINYGTVAEAIANGWVDAKCIKPNKYPNTLMAAWGSGELFDVDTADMPRLAEDVAEAILLIEKEVIGPSVDAGSAQAVLARKGSDQEITEEELEALWSDDSGEDVELEMLFTEYQIAAATLVPIPAYAECRPFEIIDNVEALTASIRSTGWNDLPLADRDLEWDGPAAEKRIADQAGIGGDSPDWGSYAEAFLYQDDEADPETKQAYGFQIVDSVDDQRMVVPRAVFAVAAILQGARGGTTISQEDQDAMKSVVESIYQRMAEEFDDDTIVAPWASDSASIIASLTAAAPTYDSATFDDPKLARITPITITEDGEVFGHIATHDTCHVGMPRQCVTAPMSNRNYSDFHRYALPTPDGHIEVGRITTGLGNFACTCKRCRGRNDDHACLQLNAAGAIGHHDKLSTIAWVRCGEDTKNNAIWVHGVLNPDASIDDIASLAKARVSGDWRPVGGNSELVEVLSLAKERAGFPLPSVRMANGRVHVLTAAGVVRPSEDEPGIDYERLGRIVAHELASRLAQPIQSVQEDQGDQEVLSVRKDPEPDGTIDSDLVESLLGELGEAVHGADASSLMAEIEGMS